MIRLGTTKKEWVDNVYEMFQGPQQVVDWSEMVWHKFNIPPVRVVAWLALWGCLATKDRVKRYRPNLDLLCCLCRQAEESHKHLFFECGVAKQVMQRTTHFVGLDVMTVSLKDWVLLFHNTKSKNSMLFKLRAATLCTCMYVLWITRNHVLFRGSNCDVEQCCFRVYMLLQYRWSSLGICRSRKVEEIGVNLCLW